MAWEERNGRQYYYRKRRAGRRVISEYMGAGDLAGLLAQLDQAERARQEQDRQARQEERAGERKLDRLLDDLQANVGAIVAGYLQAAGYHQHKGQWRRMKNDRNRPSKAGNENG